MHWTVIGTYLLLLSCNGRRLIYGVRSISAARGGVNDQLDDNRIYPHSSQGLHTWVTGLPDNNHIASAARTQREGVSPIPLDGGGWAVAWFGIKCCVPKISLYFDLACDDTANAWPVIREVMLSVEFRDYFTWDIHLLPLPYHRAAFPLSIAIRALRSLAEGKGYPTNLYAMQFIDVVLGEDFQEAILNLSNTTEDELYSIIAKLVGSSPVFGDVTMEEMMSCMKNRRFNMEARYDFKRSILNGIYSTPSVTMSGVKMEFNTASIKDWNEILTPFVTSALHEASAVTQN
eukprot:376781_1